MSIKIGLLPEQKMALRLLCNTCNINQLKWAMDQLMDAYIKKLPMMGIGIKGKIK